jgi:ribosomal-protein-alanine N-acetyltransferase
MKKGTVPNFARLWENRMEDIEIRVGSEEERQWAASVMAGMDPWITLGRSIDACRKACHNPEFWFYVAHYMGAPSGFILIHPHGVAGSPYVASIAVADGFRGVGVGTRLLRFAEEISIADARHIFLCVSSFNPRARALYERQGYAPVGELRDYIIRGASEILMQKRLREA